MSEEGHIDHTTSLPHGMSMSIRDYQYPIQFLRKPQKKCKLLSNYCIKLVNGTDEY